MIEKEFVPYEEAFALKELGFNEPCLGYYLCKNSAFGIDDLEITTERIDLIRYDYASCVVPTFSQVFRWFRENYGLSGTVCENFVGDVRCGIINVKSEIGLKYLKSGQPLKTKLSNTYEEAELECLNKLIEIIKTV
jgi:hypothetical protein